MSTQDRFDFFFLDYRDEFNWYITRVRRRNQLTHEKAKKGFISESFSSDK